LKAWAVKAFYDVVECKHDLVKEYIEEYGEGPNYKRFVNLVVIVTCKVTPTSPKCKKTKSPHLINLTNLI